MQQGVLRGDNSLGAINTIIQAREYRKDKHPFPTWSTVNSRKTKGHAPYHHPDILLPFNPHLQKSSSTTATFRPHRGQQTQRFQGELRRILEIRRDVVDPRGIAAGAGRAEDDEQQNDAESGARAGDRQRGRGRRNPHGKRCMSNNPIRNLFILKE